MRFSCILGAGGSFCLGSSPQFWRISTLGTVPAPEGAGDFCVGVYTVFVNTRKPFYIFFTSVPARRVTACAGESSPLFFWREKYVLTQDGAACYPFPNGLAPGGRARVVEEQREVNTIRLRKTTYARAKIMFDKGRDSMVQFSKWTARWPLLESGQARHPHWGVASAFGKENEHPCALCQNKSSVIFRHEKTAVRVFLDLRGESCVASGFVDLTFLFCSVSFFLGFSAFANQSGKLSCRYTSRRVDRTVASQCLAKFGCTRRITRRGNKGKGERATVRRFEGDRLNT